MAMNNFDPIANRLGYTREQMIAKYGERGTKPLSEIAKAEGVNESELLKLAGQNQQQNQQSNWSDLNLQDLVGDGYDFKKDLVGILGILNQILTKLMETLGVNNNLIAAVKTEEDTDKTTAGATETSETSNNSGSDVKVPAAITDSEVNFFETSEINVAIPQSTDTASTGTEVQSSETSNDAENTNEKDNINKMYKKYKNTVGKIDKKTFAAIVKAAGTGKYTGSFETVTSSIREDLGLPESADSKIASVLEFLAKRK